MSKIKNGGLDQYGKADPEAKASASEQEMGQARASENFSGVIEKNN